MRYGSVCSGIEAATQAWHPLGWQPVFFSEIEKFPRAVLEHRYPDVPLHGDFTTIKGDEYGAIDLLVGGTPCQSFSVAGLRKGLDDPRGNLALGYLGLLDRTRPGWMVWENVPGVLSSNKGRDFGSFLGALAELGYGFAYRILDAQHFGVPQRRRRIFVVGHTGDWRPAAAVLFERDSLCGHPPPRRQAGPSVAALTANGVGTCGADDNQGQAGHLIPSTGNTAHCLNAGGMGRQDYETETLIAHTLRGEGFDASEDGTGRGTPLVPVAFQSKQSASAKSPSFDAVSPTLDVAKAGGMAVAYPLLEVGARTGVSTDDPRAGIGIGHRGDPMFTLQASKQHGVAVSIRGREGGATAEITDGAHPALRASQGGGDKPHVLTHSAVRRLTPVECERLQGFPDDFTRIPWRGKPAEQCPDGPRYKALGNSMAVPVMRWIGERIQAVSDIP